MRTRDVILICIMPVFAAPARAQVHAGDIVVRRNAAGNRIVTGISDEITGEVTMGPRAFIAEFGDPPNFTNEPGFDSGAGEWPFPSQIGFTIQRALRLWSNGNFGTIPAERIEVKLGPLGPVLTPMTDLPTTGFSLSVSSDGEYHHHLGYTLLGPASDGIYLYEATLWTNIGGVDDSEPFFIVFSQNQPTATLEEAFLWVERNLVGCASDFNSDGFVTGDDFDGFVVEFENGNAAADFNGDGFVTGDDFDAFVSAFEGGC